MIDILVRRRREPRGGFYHVLIAQGRPAAADAIVPLFSPEIRAGLDRVIVEAAAWADGDQASGVAAAARLAARTPRNDNERSMIACTLAQWAFARGQPVTTDPETIRGTSAPCARLVALMKAAQSGAPELDQLLAETDSITRERVFLGQMNGAESHVLARIWAARGNPQRALSAIRLRVESQTPAPGLYGSVRDEGRYAEAAADTAGAVRAYRRYLRMRHDPEPVLIPQRDSVIAALARLEHRATVP